MNDDSLVDWLALISIPQIGPSTILSLIDHFGSPSNVLSATREELSQLTGIGTLRASSIAGFKKNQTYENELKICRDHGVTIIPYTSHLYPNLLKNTVGAPPVLFAQGQLDLLHDQNLLGVVGSRNCTQYGSLSCQKIVMPLVKNGVGIVSGFASGIDIIAHKAALEAGGNTIGVLGGGLGCIYPKSNLRYHLKMLENGVLLSEHFYNTEPLPPFFPRRNRIISGLSRGTLVIEATKKSGALITAQYALEQNRDVFAVPGPISSSRSVGCHELIRSGAQLVSSAQNILDEWNLRGSNQQELLKPQFKSQIHRDVYLNCQSKALTVDELVKVTRFASQHVLLALTELEMQGLIHSLPGGHFQSINRISL